MNKKISMNGTLTASDAANFNLADSDVCYGYGCYETLKVRDSLLYFAEFHAQRLLNSADILGISHTLTIEKIVQALEELVKANADTDANIKVLLIGHEGRGADWYVFSLPALYPPAGSAQQGVDCLVFHGERQFPQAKSLSMLLSTIAYRKASAQGCYDALLINHRNEITEGTRTNVFFASVDEPNVILTPPAVDVLSGITRKTFLQCLAEDKWPVQERVLPLSEVLAGRYGLLVSSTSTRLVPVKSLLQTTAEGRSLRSELPLLDSLQQAAALYERWLADYASQRKGSK